MKAVVLEIKNGRAAVLREDGVITQIRRKCAVGDTIEIHKVSAGKIVRFAFPAVAAIFLAISGSLYYYNTAMAYSYVTVDGESGVQLTLNRQNEVIDVTALSETTEDLVNELIESGIDNISVEDAVDMITNAINADNTSDNSDTAEVVTTDEPDIDVTVTSKDEETANAIRNTINKKRTEKNQEQYDSKESEIDKETDYNDEEGYIEENESIQSGESENKSYENQSESEELEEKQFENRDADKQYEKEKSVEASEQKQDIYQNNDNLQNNINEKETEHIEVHP
jgi:hypothetical protein